MARAWLSLFFELLPFQHIGQLPRPAEIRQDILLHRDLPAASLRAPWEEKGEEEKGKEEDHIVQRTEGTVERKEGRGMASGRVHRAGARCRSVCHRWPVQLVGWRRAPDFAAGTWARHACC